MSRRSAGFHSEWGGTLDPLRVAVFLLIILNVSRINSHFSAINVLRPSLLLVLITAGYAFLNPTAVVQDRLMSTLQAKVFAGLGIMACLSVIFGISMGGSGLFIITNFSKVLLTGFVVIAAIRRGHDMYLFVWAYVISCGVLVWMGWFVFGLSTRGSAVARLGNLYTYDANDVGLVLLVGLPLSLLTFESSGRLGKLVSLFVLLGISATVARSGSRGAFLGFIAVILALLVLMKTVSIGKRVITVAAVVLALVLATGPGYWTQMSTMLSPKDDYNWTKNDGRKAITKRGLGYMMQYPLFGLGIGNFARAECMISEKAEYHIAGTGIKCSPPHNTWIQVGGELGFPGLLLWTMLVLGGIVGMNRLRRLLPRSWLNGDREGRFLYRASLYFPVAMIAFAVTSTFLSFAWIDIVYILAGFMAGLSYSVKRKLMADGQALTHRSRSPRTTRFTRPPIQAPPRVALP